MLCQSIACTKSKKMPTEAFYLTYGVHNVCVCEWAIQTKVTKNHQHQFPYISSKFLVAVLGSTVATKWII
jgi:hypothetical protein